METTRSREPNCRPLPTVGPQEITKPIRSDHKVQRYFSWSVREKRVQISGHIKHSEH